ncbi:ABC transporter [Sphingobium sp. CR2-8]|uniref:ABC transporter n=1 Tax=Sphingobium sp. CR2-8 TaxID=1306534 RepID=UPI002DBA42D8|nr:ABC transporter [Sphingobium sp. CR2-8]MEC3910494.1 ABC transporter [Sphingobium sp. CR2-8]
MAGVRQFLGIWLPSLLIFLIGLKRAWLTGQADPWDWGLPAAMVSAAVGLLLARRSWAMLAWVAMGGIGTALIFCTIAAARAPDVVAALGLLAVALLALFGGSALRQPPFGASLSRTSSAARSTSRLRWKRRLVGMAFLILAGLILWRGPTQQLQPVPDRPKLAVVTGLPLFWAESGQDGPQDAPIITVLRTRFTVVPLDDPLQLSASRARRLLLAQPRALTPPQRVAIDRWVRDGGTALVLADPLLRWPSTLPLGDRRRAPSAHSLAPLLDHWGFEPSGRDNTEIRHFSPDGALITVSGAQFFGADGDRDIQRKRVGEGQVLLLGDADPIDDRLWLADPAHPLDPRLWVADTPARVAQWLGASIPGARHWMREAADVTAALRWALLAGMIWAILGAILFRQEKRGTPGGTKSETYINNARKSD